MRDGQKDSYGSYGGGTDCTSLMSFILLINIHSVHYGPGTILGTGALAMKTTYKILYKASTLECSGQEEMRADKVAAILDMGQKRTLRKVAFGQWPK